MYCEVLFFSPTELLSCANAALLTSTLPLYNMYIKQMTSDDGVMQGLMFSYARKCIFKESLNKTSHCVSDSILGKKPHWFGPLEDFIHWFFFFFFFYSQCRLKKSEELQMKVRLIRKKKFFDIGKKCPHSMTKVFHCAIDSVSHFSATTIKVLLCNMYFTQELLCLCLQMTRTRRSDQYQ